MPITRSVWTDDDGSGTTGTPINNAELQKIYNNVDAFVPSAWTPYTPLWAGQGGTVAPTLGDGILSGRFHQIGSWVDVAIVLRLGSLSTLGDNTFWTLTLPLPMKQATPIAQETVFRCGVLSGGGGAFGGVTAFGFLPTYVYAATHAGGLIGPATPFAWGPNALWTVRGSYEVG